jgi:small-conductance mechanosensitive channel
MKFFKATHRLAALALLLLLCALASPAQQAVPPAEVPASAAQAPAAPAETPAPAAEPPAQASTAPAQAPEPAPVPEPATPAKRPALAPAPAAAVPAPATAPASAAEQKAAAVQETTEAGLTARLGEVEASISDTLRIESGAAAPPADVTLEAVQGRTAALRTLQMALQQRLSGLRDHKAARERLAASEKTRDEFKGLDDPPPYTMAYVDQLLDDVNACQMDLDTEKLAAENVRQLLDMMQQDATSAKTALNQAVDAIGAASDEAAKNRANWAAETARIAWRAAESQLAAAGTAQERLQAQVRRLEADLDLAKRKAGAGRAQLVFKESELKELLTKQDAAVAGVEREIQSAHRELVRRSAQLADFERRAETATDPQAADKARADVDIAKDRVEAHRSVLSTLENIQRCEEEEKNIFETRFKISQGGMPAGDAALAETLKRLQTALDTLNGIRRVSEQRGLVLRTQIATQEKQLDSLPGGDATRAAAQKRLEALRERGAVNDRLQRLISELSMLNERALDELKAHMDHLSPTERVTEVSRWVKSLFGSVADRELAEVDGKSITPRKLVNGLIILAVGFLLSRLILRYLRNRLFPRLGIRTNVALITENLTKYFLLFLVCYAALHYLNIPLTVFTFLGGAVAIGVGFGAQNLINNFLSGLILMGEQPIRVGDIVEVEGLTGSVVNIGARASALRTFSGIDVLIPNSKFLENKVVNWTLTDGLMRYDVKVGVGYGSPTRDVARIMHRAVTEHGKVLKDPEPVVVFEDFGENALVFTVYFWLEVLTTDARVVRSDLRHIIGRRFEEAGISMAYPQREVHLNTAEPIRIQMIPPGGGGPEETP